MGPDARPSFTSKVVQGPPKRRVYVASDIDEDEDVAIHPRNKCTKEAEPQVKPEFDYARYHEFCRLKGLQSQLHRLLDEITEPTWEESQRQPSDEVLKQTFVQRFGPVDFNDPLMIKRLEVMRTSLEAANLPVGEDNLLNQLLEVGIEGPGGKMWIHDDTYDPEGMLATKISDEFSWKELQMFNSFNPAQARGDWFNLPRGDLSIIREEHFAQEKIRKKQSSEKKLSSDPGNPDTTGTSNKDLSTKPRLKNPLKNLHLYDPKFEFCFQMPYRIFNTFDNDEGDEFPKILALRILEHLNQFPNGVTRNYFWETYYAQTKVFPSIYGMEIMNVFNYLPGEVCIIPEKGTLPELIFPGFLEDFVDPSLVLKRVWHSILCLMSRHPYIVVADLFPGLENELGIKFNPLHWGYKPKDFLDWCLTYFGSEGTFIVKRITFYRNYITSTEDYFAVKSPFLLDQMEDRSGNVPKKRVTPKVPPKGYVGRQYKITHISDLLSAGERHLVDLIANYDPHRLVFELFKYRSDHYSFQRRLQKSPLIEEILDGPTPRDDQLFPGMYVMVYIHWRGRMTEWYRARIVWKYEKTNKYFVWGLDDGFYRYVELDLIRFMPIAAAEEMAYAIPVQLLVEHPTKKRRRGWYNWEWDASEFLDEFLRPNHLLFVQWKRRAYCESLGCSRWGVNCSVVTYPGMNCVHYSASDKLYTALAKWIKEKDKARRKRRAKRASIMPPLTEAVEETTKNAVDPTPKKKPNSSVPEKAEENKENIVKNSPDGEEGIGGTIKSQEVFPVQD